MVVLPLCGALAVGGIVFVFWALQMASTHYSSIVRALAISAVAGGLGVGAAVLGRMFYFLSVPTVRRLPILGRRGLQLGGVLLATSIVFLLGTSGDLHIETRVPATGGTIGPFTVDGSGGWVRVQVKQSIEPDYNTVFQRWSYVTVKVLDQNKNYLSSFGGEFWHYSGREAGGYWMEEDTRYEATLQFPSAGTYYARLQTEANVAASKRSPISVEMYERALAGNVRMLQRAAYAAFFIGGLLIFFPRATRRLRLLSHLNDGARIRLDDQAWDVGAHTHYEYDDKQADMWKLHPAESSSASPRFLFREYKEREGQNTNWERWLALRAVDPASLHCMDLDGQSMELPKYVSKYDQLPDALVLEGQRHVCDETGTVSRDGAAYPYGTYAEEWEGTQRTRILGMDVTMFTSYTEGKRDFLRVECEPDHSFAAFAGHQVNAFELRPLPRSDAPEQ